MDGVTFDQRRHEQLTDILTRSDYPKKYRALCIKFQNGGNIDGPSLDLQQTVGIFERTGTACKLNRRWRMFVYEEERIGGWDWQGSLVVKRHGMLEPMIEGVDHTAKVGVGSAFLVLASEAGKKQDRPITIMSPMTRPLFDGKMATMEHMVPDLVKLFRLMKDAIRRGWPTSQGTLQQPGPL